MINQNDEDDDSIYDISIHKVLRTGEILTILVDVVILVSIYLGFDPRSMTSKNFEYASISEHMFYFYIFAGFFPLVYFYIEDRRLYRNESPSKIWYTLMGLSCVITWCAVGWIVAN